MKTRNECVYCAGHSGRKAKIVKHGELNYGTREKVKVCSECRNNKLIKIGHVYYHEDDVEDYGLITYKYKNRWKVVTNEIREAW
jgi:cytochrome c1